jgi:hypothetical protein
MSIKEDLEKARRELGISGDDDIGNDEIGDYEIVGDEGDVGDYEVGDDEVVGAALPRRRAAKSQKRRGAFVRIPPFGSSGPMRVMTLPCTAVLSLAAAATGNLVFTPNRNCEILDCVLDAYVAAAAAAAFMPSAIQITDITVQGRRLNAGIGDCPITAYMPRYGWRHKPFIQWGSIDASQSVVLSLVNRDAATTHVVTGVIFVLSVP